jgi:2-methylfumaryl-CoA isomerase
LVTVEDPGIGPVTHVGSPLRLGRTPLVRPGPAPRLGADTEAVLVRVLGLTPGEVQRLEGDGVCG